MVFSSLPVYHQNPPNRHLHQQQSLLGENITTNIQLQGQLSSLPPPSYVGGGSGNTTASIKPSSMSDRARLAKIPQPEAALKCPRCESIDTKFCYFNNYSLSQPRHYCKTCRRYWTRGGAIRNVPAGGGCRRNKKSKSSKSKGGPQTKANNSSSDQRRKNITSSSSTSTTDLAPRDHHNNYIMSHDNYPHQPSQSPFLSSLQNLTHVGGMLRGIDPMFSGQNSIISADQYWSGMQHFPFVAGGLDQSLAISGNHLFAFQNGGGESRSSTPMMTSGAFRGAVKMEETLKSARPFLDYDNNNNNGESYSSWGGAWNNVGGSSADNDDENQLNSSTATAHFL